jgi:hypothetical protein
MLKVDQNRTAQDGDFTPIITVFLQNWAPIYGVTD